MDGEGGVGPGGGGVDGDVGYVDGVEGDGVGIGNLGGFGAFVETAGEAGTDGGEADDGCWSWPPVSTGGGVDGVGVGFLVGGEDVF